jgi:hypothetical protein
LSLAYRQDDSTMNFSQQRKRKDTPEKDNNHIDQEKKLSVQSSKKLTVQPRPLSFFAGISIIIYVLCFLCARHYHRGILKIIPELCNLFDKPIIAAKHAAIIQRTKLIFAILN